jgi:hypothetical protein
VAFTEFYCNASTGSNMNGGSDENGSPSYTHTNGGWNSGTGVYTPTSGDPSASGVTVGQFAHVFTDGSTTPTRIARVTAVNSTTITLSTTAGSGTAPTTAGSGISINVGGAWKGPTGASGFPLNFVTALLTDASANPPRVNLKNNATYSITSAITRSGTDVRFQGYTSSAGDGGKATLDGGTAGASYTLLTLSGARNHLVDLIFQNNGATGSSAGLTISASSAFLERVVVNSVRGTGFNLTGSPILTECEAYSCNQSNTASSGGFVASGTFAFCSRCVAHDCAGSNNWGFLLVANHLALVDCIADTITGRGFGTTANGVMALRNCVAYSSGSSGFVNTGGAGVFWLENCQFVSNSGYGVEGPGATSNNVIVSTCAFYSNTSGQTNAVNASLVTGSVTLTGSPFVAASTGDFDLNSTAGAGAACRGAGRGNFTQTQASYTGTLSYPDIGASQHQDAGGSSGPVGTARIVQNIGTY